MSNPEYEASMVFLHVYFLVGTRTVFVGLSLFLDDQQLSVGRLSEFYKQAGPLSACYPDFFGLAGLSRGGINVWGRHRLARDMIIMIR